MPDYATLPVLCRELGITLAELLDGEDEEPNSVRLYDEQQTLELIKTIQTRAFRNAKLEAAISITIAIALFAVCVALYETHGFIASFVMGLAGVIIAISIYSSIEEKRFAFKSKDSE